MDSPPNFDFTHESDWQQQSREIVNTVQNNHQKNSLIVSWPAAGIEAPRERPIPPTQSDVNRYYCPEEQLVQNLTAQLFYGLSRIPKTAGVYEIQQKSPGGKTTSNVLRSEIMASTPTEPYKLEVHSTAVPEKFVEYRFVQNRPFDFALPLPPGFLPAFSKAGWEITPHAFKKFPSLKLGEHLRKRISDLDAYTLLKPSQLESVVTISVAAFQERVVLLLISDKKRNVVASGLVSLHLP
ncbi:hypothetical protein MYX75_07010 [Acidobacteria bacterium AH-259-A15]|nr:hypothetical protein [Acidobacteria bacterium AH-259-A15]